VGPLSILSIFLNFLVKKEKKYWLPTENVMV
jgi:hypothetical protein